MRVYDYDHETFRHGPPSQALIDAARDAKENAVWAVLVNGIWEPAPNPPQSGQRFLIVKE
jgi:hypothetical protein